MRKPMLVAIVAAVALVIGIAITPVMKTEASTGATAYRADGPNGTVVNVDLSATETVQEIAPGVKYDVWTFNGTAPGPVIRVQLGDTIHFTLTNDSKIGMQHSIDFHAAMTPWADLPAAGADTLTGNYQPVNPGETKTFDPFDRFEMYEATKGKTMDQLLERFTEARAANLNALDAFNLKPEQLELRGMHPGLGSVTLGQLLHTWVLHDISHITQITRTMSRQLGPDIGPWTEFFSLFRKPETK